MVYLKRGGLLEHAQRMAAHASAKTTKLYDRREDTVTLDEVEKIGLRPCRTQADRVKTRFAAPGSIPNMCGTDCTEAPTVAISSGNFLQRGE
jgi:hypothetical protein